MLNKQRNSPYPLVFVLVVALSFFLPGRYFFSPARVVQEGDRTIFPFAASPVLPFMTQPWLRPQAATNGYILTYTVDRTAVPPVYHRDLTLRIYIGPATAVETSSGDGSPIHHQYDWNSGYLTVTTTAATFFVHVANPADLTQMGNFSKAALKDNKKWAWSHGMDDNQYLQASIEVLAARGWRGTLFLIGSQIHETRQEPWIIDAVDIKQLAAEGWSFGNHTWHHICSPPRIDDPVFMRDTIVDGYNRLVSIIQASPVPNYQVIAFAAPCFRAEYQPYIQEMIDNDQTAVRFNESGNDHTLVINPGASDYTHDGRTAVAFNYSRAIGRDIRLELGGDGVADVKAHMDWLSAQAAPSRHFWYNTLSHGNQETSLNQAVQHAYNLYGPGGSDELWMAPADAVYSYLLVRDHSQVTFTVSAPLSYRGYLPAVYR
jgi:hypothetical protein